MPSSIDQEKFPERATGPELGVGESLLAGVATGSDGILERVPDDLRGKLPDELVDELLGGAKTEEEFLGQGGLFYKLPKRLVEVGKLIVGLATKVTCDGLRWTISVPSQSASRWRWSWSGS